MILVTGCNERYQYRMNGYLDSLEQYADFPVKFIGVGFMPSRSSDKITPLPMTQAQNYGAPPETESIQHGSFTAVIGGKLSDVLMYTDGDFAMQRPMDDSERQFFALKLNQVAVGYNGGAGETLADEAARLGQKVSDDHMDAVWGSNWRKLSIYNVGCIAATRATWVWLHEAYLQTWTVACDCFSHAARQQWLISWLVQEDFEPVIIPWSIHAHGHFGMKQGMAWGSGGIWADGKLALFRHYL